MARIRTIKPAFFRHSDLFQAERETGLPLRVAFAGLWTAADREGRFAWRPLELKLDCLPHDDVDFSRVLDALTTRGFLVRYASADGREYGAIPSWSKHQVINNREGASEIPAPPSGDVSATSTRAPRVTDACPTPLVHAQGEGKGMEGNGESTRALAPAPKRQGYADPHGMRLDPTAAAHVVVGPEQLVAIPGHWWTKARREYRLTDADLDAFVAFLKGYTQRHGFEDGGKRLPYLDARLADFRAERANPNDGLRPASEWIAERMKRDAEIPEISAERRRELLRPVRAVKA